MTKKGQGQKELLDKKRYCLVRAMNRKGVRARKGYWNEMGRHQEGYALEYAMDGKSYRQKRGYRPERATSQKWLRAG